MYLQITWWTYNFQVYIFKVQYHNLRDHASINWSAADSGNAITKFCQCLYIKPKCNLLKRWNVKPFRVSFFIANMAKKLKELILSRDIPTYMYFFWAREWKLCNDGPRIRRQIVWLSVILSIPSLFRTARSNMPGADSNQRI